MVKGKVTRKFNKRKGFGYLLLEGSEKEIVVYQSSIQVVGNTLPHLTEGDEVEFTIEQGQKGEEAKNVVILKHMPKPKLKRRNGNVNLGKFQSPEVIEKSDPRKQPIRLKDPYGSKIVKAPTEPESEDEKRSRLHDQRNSND